MTREQFDRATELNQKIQKYSDLIGRIRLGISVKRKEDEKAEKGLMQENQDLHHEKWTLLRFFRLTLTGKKVIAMPHYEFGQGIEMDADAELIGIIIEYLERKKKECEEEFEQIGGKSE